MSRELDGRPGRAAGWLGRHRRAAILVGLGGLALVAFVLVWFQPQKLFLNQRVDEAVPGAAVGAGSSAPPPATPAASGTGSVASPGGVTPTPAAGAVTLRSGSFRSLEHGTSGEAVVLALAGGQRILRLEDLDTSNGPDLHVYLSEVAASDDLHAYGERFVDLGKLKGNIGSQNYDLPPGLDLSRYRSAVIWCKRFSVGFGVAPLDAP